MTMVMAGPGGSKSHAVGTHGTTTGTNYQNNNVSFEDSWGFVNDGKGNVQNNRNKVYKK